MRRVELWNGTAFTVYSLELSNGSRPIRDFIQDLEREDQRKLFPFIKRVAEHGPPGNNPEKSRAVEGETNLYELKSFKVRIMYFYAGEGIIVLTHGFMKHSGPPVGNEIERAKRIREEYLSIWGE